MFVNYHPNKHPYAWVWCHKVVDDFGNELFIGGTYSASLAWYFLGIERAIA